MNNILTDDDIKFLKELAIELKNQERHYTGKPVYYQIWEKKDRFGIDVDYADQTCILIGDDYEDFKDFNEAIKRCEEYEMCDIQSEEWIEVKESEEFYYLAEYLKKKGYNVTYTGVTQEDTYTNAFLTSKACREHIGQNHYHYKNPRIFTQHGWRNPELQRLLEIVEKFADAEESE